VAAFPLPQPPETHPAQVEVGASSGPTLEETPHAPSEQTPYETPGQTNDETSSRDRCIKK